MENRKRRREGDGGMEANTLAILETSGFDESSQFLNDDKMSFLEAVRAASIVLQNGSAPTKKMFEAIFGILKDADSLDLVMASYQLLNDLDKRFPRVCISNKKKSKMSLPTAAPELVVVEEAWSPFNLGSDFSSIQEAKRNSGGSIDSSGFLHIVREFASVARDEKFKPFETKLLKNMLLLQYLINVLKGDFLPRNCIFRENMNWTIIRGSLLNLLLGSRINYKGIVEHCVSIMSEIPNHLYEVGSSTYSSVDLSGNCDAALSIALPEIGKDACMAVQRLILMMMELDESRKIADMQGFTSRADGVRTPVAEIILDELTYNKDIISPFFRVFDEPNWKLEIVVQYFRKYISKSSVRTRRSNGSTENVTFDGILKFFADSSSAKGILKKISPEVAQVLLAHGFQAYISLPSQHSSEAIGDSTKDTTGISVFEICKSMISAYTCLIKTDKYNRILPLGQEALFAAATILARLS